MRRFAVAVLCSALIALTGLWFATGFIADVFAHQPGLGAPLLVVGTERIYAPWSIFAWTSAHAEMFPKPFAVARLVVLAAFVAALIPLFVAGRGKLGVKPFGAKAWGEATDAKAAGLFADTGTVLGKFGRDILCFAGAEHQLLIGASRSGKGRGHVVPTLLAWPHSALVLDVKGELADGDPGHGFPGTSGFRATLGPVLRFAPTRMDSAAFNPLFEVRKGANEIRDVQNIVEILVDPHGDGRNQDFWDRSAKGVLVGLILHVLYAEPEARKTLAVVREKLRDLDATALAMKSTLHRLNAVSGKPKCIPKSCTRRNRFSRGKTV